MVETESKGLGLIANKNIKIGDKIIEEIPIVLVDHNNAHNDIINGYNNLSENIKLKYFEL